MMERARSTLRTSRKNPARNEPFLSTISLIFSSRTATNSRSFFSGVLGSVTIRRMERIRSSVSLSMTALNISRFDLKYV